MSDRTSAGSCGSVSEEIEAVLDALRAEGELSEQSLPRVEDLATRLSRYAATGLGLDRLAELSVGDARRFIEAASDQGPVSASTMHLRRTTLRLLFRTARRLGIVDGDPTLDIDLPHRSPLHTRPLECEEVAICRSAALHTLTSTRLAAAWALSEATARTAELPRLTVGDLDLEQQRVWIHGGGRTEPRWGHLGEWGVRQLSRHVESLNNDDPMQLLVYRGAGSAESKQASACIAVGDVLARAGLGDEPDVRPLSVVGWAGRTVLEETARIEEVARRLGMRSLDRAAELIGFDWTAGQ